MRRLGPAFLAFILSAHPAWSADEIVGPAAVPVHSLATVSTPLAADSYIWLVFPTESTYPADQADPKVLQFAGHPGPHQVILVPLKDGKQVGQYRKVVTFGGAALPFPPTPDPKPPGPVPSTDPLNMTLVYDVENMSTSVATLRTDASIRKAAADLNFYWRSYDDDAASVATHAPAVAEAGGVPALVVQDSSGKVLGCVPCPPTAEGVIDVMESYRHVAATPQGVH